MKRLATFLCTLFLLFPLLGGLFLAPSAHAAVPVDETNPTLLTDAVIQQWWINIQRVLVASLKQQLISTLSNMTLSWLQGGGDPRFITDWGRYAGNVAFGAAAKWFKDWSGVNICDPFKPFLLPIFDPRRLLTPPLALYECTLDRFLGGVGGIGNRIELFRNDFAAGGGWDAWLALASPENNPYWIAYNGMQAQAAKVAEETRNAELQGLANQGFLGSRKCVETYLDELGGESCIRWQITTPGIIEKDIASQYLAAAEKDLIVNTDDLTQLVGALTSLTINRILASGEGGILELAPQGAPSSGTFTQSGCAGLTGQAQAICLQEQASEPVCGPVFQQFIEVLVETKNIKQGSATELNTFIGTLEQLKNRNCRDTSAEIASRQIQKARVEQDITQLATVIQTFSTASCDFVPPKSLETLRTERAGAQTERAAIQAATTQAQNELSACTTTPTPTLGP